jgi:hypothetical protein
MILSPSRKRSNGSQGAQGGNDQKCRVLRRSRRPGRPPNYDGSASVLLRPDEEVQCNITGNRQY